MEQLLTHHDTLALQEVVELGGDLLLLPEQMGRPTEELHAMRAGGMIPIEGSTIADATLNIFQLSQEYCSYRGRYGKEPAWIAEMPISVRTRLRYDYVIMEEDTLAIMNGFPHTGISYAVRGDGLCEKVEQTFGLRRLQRIKQLGFLQTPWLPDSLSDQPLGTHNRYIHSLDVMTLATLVGHNLGLSEAEFNTLRVAAFTHDMGTPAGGDSVKLIDLPALDEDLNYGRLLDKLNWRPIRDKYSINRKTLIDTIHNKGKLGIILDIVDKLAYVARDLHACRPYIDYGEHHLEQDGLASLLKILERYPLVCSIWDAVSMQDRTVVIDDARRLGAFLKVRTLLFRELYMHPHARFGEYLVSRVLVKALYDTGKLTRDQLLSMSDDDLRMVLNTEYLGRHTSSKGVIEETSDGAKCKTFTNREDADAFLAALRASGNPFSLLEDNTRLIKTATHLKVRTKSGPMTFANAFPGDAQEIEEMAQILPVIHVYYLEHEPQISRAKLAELAECMRAP